MKKFDVEWSKKEWKSKINLMGTSHRSVMSSYRRLQKSLQVKPFKNFPCESEDGDANIFQTLLRSKDFQDWTLGTTRNSTNHFKFLELIHSLATFWHEIVKRNIIQGTCKSGHQIGNPNFFWHFLTYICSYFWILGPKCFASENMNRDILARTLVAEVSISRIPFWSGMPQAFWAVSDLRNPAKRFSLGILQSYVQMISV